jgi:putative addiction module component (TIGR02574 family)
MILERFPEVERLSSEEKLQLATELWNEIEGHPSDVPVDQEILDELRRRMEHFKSHPEQCTTWEKVRDKLLGSQP